MTENRFIQHLPEPVDAAASLEVFRRPGDDLIDRYDGSRLIRTVPMTGGFVPYSVRVEPGLQDSLDVVAGSNGGEELETVVRALFVFATPDMKRLAGEDPVMAMLDERHPGVRPVLQHDLFTALVRSISAQQINLRWAATIRARLAQRFGDRHHIGGEFVYSLDVERIANADLAEIREMQFTTRKAEAIVELAREVVSGGLSLDALRALENEAIVERLVRLRGIGLWSAEWIICRTLGRPRVVAGDLGVRKAIGHAYTPGSMPSEAEVRGLTMHWGESSSVAQGLVLHAYAVGAALGVS